MERFKELTPIILENISLQIYRRSAEFRTRGLNLEKIIIDPWMYIQIVEQLQESMLLELGINLFKDHTRIEYVLIQGIKILPNNLN